MILQRAGLNPLCRQCGHPIDRPASRCPMCGMATGVAAPLRSALGNVVDEPSFVAEVLEEGDLDDDADEIVLAPPIERPPPEPVSIATRLERDVELETPDEPVPVARNVSLGSLLLGTLLIAACLGLGRVSIAAGCIAFLVLVPAYFRTLSALWYYRERKRRLGGHDIAGIFATSLVLALMGLAAGGLVFLVTTFLSGLVVHAFEPEDPVTITNVLGVSATFVTVLVMVHRVWPVNED